MRDYISFNKEYKNEMGFPFLETSSKEYDLQKYFEVRLEHYIRNVLINDVIQLILEDKGVGVYKSELANDSQSGRIFYSNKEYEQKAGYEFVVDYGNETIMYRYTDVNIEEAESLLTDFEDKIVVLDWEKPSKSEKEKSLVFTNGKELSYSSLYEFFRDRIGIEEYQEYISFLTGEVIEFQEFIGVKSVPKLSPFSLGRFRFEVENNFIKYIDKIREYIKSDEKVLAMGISGVEGINYGYRVIDDENKAKFGSTEYKSKELLRNGSILELFEKNKLYRFLIGGADFAKSFITSEYLFKQYDCDDCFDYTAIVSGYLKSIEQLLYHIVNFSKDKGYKIKNNGQKNKEGVYPLSINSGKVYKIDFVKENDGCFDTTIGSLIHFLNDNKLDILVIDDDYKKTIIDCLNCYRIECRNDSFHLDNNYKWSRVEFIRWNTFLIYILLLSCCRLGDTERHTKDDLKVIEDDRLERLYDIISKGKNVMFEFVFIGDMNTTETMRVKYIPVESSYPSYDNIGRIKSVYLTFEDIRNNQKIIIMRRNVPEEMYYIDEDGIKTKIE